MSFTAKQSAFIAEYLKDFNATQAALRAGYSERTAYAIGHENLKKPEIFEEIQRQINDKLMTAEEALIRKAEVARFDISPYVRGAGRSTYIDAHAMIEDGFGHLIRAVKTTDKSVEIKTADPDSALDTILKWHERAGTPTGSKEDPVYIRYITENRTDDD